MIPCLSVPRAFGFLEAEARHRAIAPDEINRLFELTMAEFSVRREHEYFGLFYSQKG